MYDTIVQYRTLTLQQLIRMCPVTHNLQVLVSNSNKYVEIKYVNLDFLLLYYFSDKKIM